MPIDREKLKDGERPEGLSWSKRNISRTLRIIFLLLTAILVAVVLISNFTLIT